MNMICEFTFVFLLIIGSTFSHNIVIREITYEGEESNGGNTNVNSAGNIDARTATGSGSGEGSGATDETTEETLDVTMTFTQAWDDALTDTSSQAYQDAVTQANDALQQMTGLEDLSGVTWTFSQGSVIATANVPVPAGTTDTAADIQARIQSFDTSTIPNLGSVAAEVVVVTTTAAPPTTTAAPTTTPLTSCAQLLMPTNGAVLSCSDGYLLGSVCTFSCVSDFYIVGSSVLTCGQDGSWDAAAPVCSDAPTTTVPPTTTTQPPTTTTQPPTTTTVVTTTTSGSSITKGAFNVLVVSSLLVIQNLLF